MLPLYLIALQRKTLLIASVSVVSVFLLGISIYQVNAQILTGSLAGAPPHSSADKVYLGAPAAAAVPADKKPVIHEVNIANNGLVLLRGATVIALSGGTLRVGMTWGAGEFTWKIETDSGTQFMTLAGEKQHVKDIAVGDIITVTGMLKSNGSEPVIGADYVRK